ncbi:MAG: amidohydrolase, partial [Sphingomicrobium sp.]
MNLDSLGSWSAAALDEQESTVALRRDIHSDPELGLDCPRTRDKLKAALAGLPLAIRDSRRTSGFVALLDGT